MRTSEPTGSELQDFVEKVKQRANEIESGESDDADIANALEKEIGSIYRRLRTRGRAAQQSLYSLLDDPDPNVRGAAATYVLDFEPDRALPVLEEVAAIPRGGFAGTRAELTLDVWKSGKYKIT